MTIHCQTKFITSSSISSSSTSFSSGVVAALVLLVLDIFEPIVGDPGNQLAAPESLAGEDATADFLDK